MGIFKRANETLDRIVREEVDEARERTRQECREQVRQSHENRGQQTDR
ncbi:hypothetical protein [Prauserella endophytica]|nr:hypothetical protein [Prauserella endophytica]